MDCTDQRSHVLAELHACDLAHIFYAGDPAVPPEAHVGGAGPYAERALQLLRFASQGGRNFSNNNNDSTTTSSSSSSSSSAGIYFGCSVEQLLARVALYAHVRDEFGDGSTRRAQMEDFLGPEATNHRKLMEMADITAAPPSCLHFSTAPQARALASLTEVEYNLQTEMLRSTRHGAYRAACRAAQQSTTSAESLWQSLVSSSSSLGDAATCTGPTADEDEKMKAVQQHRAELVESPEIQQCVAYQRWRRAMLHHTGLTALLLWCRDEDQCAMSARGCHLESDNERCLHRVAHYALPTILREAFLNYIHTDGDENVAAAAVPLTQPSSTTSLPSFGASRAAAPLTLTAAELIRTRVDAFVYWSLACLTTDCPADGGPNALGSAGGEASYLDAAPTFFAPPADLRLWHPALCLARPSPTTAPLVLPSIWLRHRRSFVHDVATPRGLPVLLAMAPVSYSIPYRDAQSGKAVDVQGTLDFLIYDLTNQRVLLMLHHGTTIISSSSTPEEVQQAMHEAHATRYRLAHAVRAALSAANTNHPSSSALVMRGPAVEYFFDPSHNAEESYYCAVAPPGCCVREKSPLRQPTSSSSARVHQQLHGVVEVPLAALADFARCPPRYLRLTSPGGRGRDGSPPWRYAYREINTVAMALSQVVPRGWVRQHLLHLTTPAAQQDEEEGGGEVALHPPAQVLVELRQLLLEQRPQWPAIHRVRGQHPSNSDVCGGEHTPSRRHYTPTGSATKRRTVAPDVAAKPPPMRTPLQVFDDLLREQPPGRYDIPAPAPVDVAWF